MERLENKMSLEELEKQLREEIHDRRVKNQIEFYDELTEDELREQLLADGELYIDPVEDAGFESDNFKLIESPLVWKGSNSEDFTRQMIFLHKPSGKHYALEAFHNSYEYMEFDKFKEVTKQTKTVEYWG